MSFHRSKDKIAITLPRFTLRRRADGVFQRRNEPYIVSLAIDESTGTSNPAIDMNALPFPNVVVGSTVEMLGHGHLLYGPKHPGEWVALSVLFMESDQDLRDLGATVDAIVKSKATDLAIKAVLMSQPTYGTALAMLKELTVLVANALKANKDDELFRTEGVFLRDHAVPFDVNRQYVRRNEWIEATIKVLPMKTPNGQGQCPASVEL